MSAGLLSRRGLIVAAALLVGIVVAGPEIGKVTEPVTEFGLQIVDDYNLDPFASPGGVLTPPPYSDRIKDCTPEQLTKDRRCRDLPIVPIDAARMPYIARHIWTAWQAGHPPLLHYEADLAERQKKNRAACAPKRIAALIGSCDEYAFQSTKEGGANASTHGVPLVEQKRQGAAIARAYTVNRLQDHDEFLVVIINSSKIAQQGYEG